MYYFIKFIVNIAFHIAFNVHFEGRENIPDGETVIYASNHRSYADPPLVGCSAKGKFAFMAKEELFKNRFFAWLIRNLGAFPVSRGNYSNPIHFPHPQQAFLFLPYNNFSISQAVLNSARQSCQYTLSD